MMSKQQQVASQPREDAIAHRPGSCLEPKITPAVDVNALDQEFDTQTSAKVSAEIGPAIGIRRQAVMDVHGPQMPTRIKCSKNMQEDDRITTARESYANVLARRRAGCKKRGNPGREATLQAVP